jgi:hypothetical protein
MTEVLPERRLSGESEAALSASIGTLVGGGRGWIALAEAWRLFSSMDQLYAFGELDQEGRDKLESFAARSRCAIDIMPEGRVYFTRKP